MVSLLNVSLPSWTKHAVDTSPLIPDSTNHPTSSRLLPLRLPTLPPLPLQTLDENPRTARHQSDTLFLHYPTRPPHQNQDYSSSPPQRLRRRSRPGRVRSCSPLPHDWTQNRLEQHQHPEVPTKTLPPPT